MKTIFVIQCKSLLILIMVFFTYFGFGQKGEIILINENNFHDFKLKIERIIPLETSDDSNFGLIERVEYQNDQFFIFDPLFTKNIISFDQTGKFLFTLDKGKETGEVQYLMNFFIYDNKLVIHNYFTLLYYDYNGKYLYDWKIPQELMFNDLIHFDEKILTFGYSPSRDAFKNFMQGEDYDARNEKHLDFVKNNLILYKVYDSDFNEEIGTFLPGNFNYYTLNTTKPFCKYNDHVLLLTTPVNDIYSFNGKDFTPVYSIDLGNKNLTKEEIDLGYAYNREKIRTGERWGHLEYINETKDFISFGVLKGIGEMSFCLYNKKSKKNAFFEDMFEKVDLNNVDVINTFGNQFICVIDPAKLSQERLGLLSERCSLQEPLTVWSNRVIMFVSIEE